MAQPEFLDVESLAGELLAPGGAHAFLVAHRNELFPGLMMENLYASRRGRPSIRMSVIGEVLVLQASEGLPGLPVRAMATGVLTGKHRRAVDSTVVADAVARQDIITRLIAVVRRFGKVIPGGMALVAVHACSYDYWHVGKPDHIWDDREAEDELISGLVTDVLALLGAVAPEALVQGSDGNDRRWRTCERSPATRSFPPPLPRPGMRTSPAR